MAYFVTKRDPKTREYKLVRREWRMTPAPLVAGVQERLADELLAHCLQVQEIVRGFELTFPDDVRLQDAGHLAALALAQLVEAHGDAWGVSGGPGGEASGDGGRVAEAWQRRMLRSQLTHAGALYEDDAGEGGAVEHRPHPGPLPEAPEAEGPGREAAPHG
jgi:hypothetical protein